MLYYKFKVLQILSNQKIPEAARMTSTTITKPSLTTREEKHSKILAPRLYASVCSCLQDQNWINQKLKMKEEGEETNPTLPDRTKSLLLFPLLGLHPRANPKAFFFFTRIASQRNEEQAQKISHPQLWLVVMLVISRVLQMNE